MIHSEIIYQFIPITIRKKLSSSHNATMLPPLPKLKDKAKFAGAGNEI